MASLTIPSFEVVLQVTMSKEVIHEETMSSDDIHPDSAKAALQKGVHKFISDACGSTKMTAEDRIAKLHEYREKLLDGTLTFSIGGANAGVSKMTFAYKALQAYARSKGLDPKPYGYRANGAKEADFGKAVKALASDLGKPRAHQRIRDAVQSIAEKEWQQHQANVEAFGGLDEIING